MNQEIELKYRLSSHHDLQRFMAFVKPLARRKIKSICQENMYFDDNQLSLRKNNISLRLRQEENKYLLCAKQSLKAEKEKLSVRLEYEAVLKNSIADLVKNEYISALDTFYHLPTKTKDDEETKMTLFRHMKKLNLPGLYCIGSFINFRTIIPIKIEGQHIDLELDHSQFPKNHEFFEVEIEFKSVDDANQCKPALEDLFLMANIKTDKTSSKSSRLYKILYP
jgi:uncharacterized protein YjbK